MAHLVCCLGFYSEILGLIPGLISVHDKITMFLKTRPQCSSFSHDMKIIIMYMLIKILCLCVLGGYITNSVTRWLWLSLPPASPALKALKAPLRYSLFHTCIQLDLYNICLCILIFLCYVFMFIKVPQVINYSYELSFMLFMAAL